MAFRRSLKKKMVSMTATPIMAKSISIILFHCKRVMRHVAFSCVSNLAYF